MLHSHRKDMIIKSNDTETFISVIIPAYNAEKYICSCLDSVLALSYQNKEIIVVDDGSTDNTGRIIDDYAEKNRNITVVHQTNKGVSAARNRGIDLARGTYLFFVDSDDEVLEDYIDQLIITGYEDLAMSLFLLQVFLAEGRRRKVVCGNTPGNLAVHFLWPGAVDVMRTQAGFYVADGDLLIEGGKGRGRGCGGVAMHKDHVGLDLFQNVAHPG